MRRRHATTRARIGFRRAALAVALLGGLICPPATAARVVSLNLCTDELLTLLSPASIAALSPLARDPALSVVARQAAQLPWVRPDAEAVLRLHPDLVLAGAYGAQAVLAALRAQGVRVVQVQEARDLAGVASQVMQVASLLDAMPAGERIVTRFWARLASLPHRPRGRAVLWQATGLSAGHNSFGGVVLRQAGFADAGTGSRMGIEALVASRPDLLVTEAAPAYPSLATDMLRHPALASIRRMAIDPAWLACPGPWSADAIAALAG